MKKRILVVDDDSMNLARTKIILGTEYDVLLVDSGMEALTKLRDEKVDMVLLDSDMPEIKEVAGGGRAFWRHGARRPLVCCAAFFAG